MNNELLATLALLVVVIVLLIDRRKQEDAAVKRETALNEQMDLQQQQWQIERKQLLDRIQAPSFSEYKNAEIRHTRATNASREARDPMGVELL